MSATIEIALGSLAEDIADQLTAAGYAFDEHEVYRMQGDAHAISRLYVRGLISESVRDCARRKLMKRIAGIVSSQQKEVEE